ncbi:hypothetical protein N431DRAFT_434886 [Stipitochalara longipes BDJ]|nr:hypothetical protein N431DRAFT_434886 [Stipitochalara longipes BDJ]
MSGLRSLTVQARWDRSLWQHQYLEKISLELLMQVELNIQNFSTAEIVKYIFLRRLKSMTIASMARPTMPKLPSNRAYGDSNIYSLNMDSNFHFPEAVLHEILRYPKHLKTLLISLPGGDISARCPRFGVDMITPLSPAAIPRSLDPVKHSLTELSLMEMDCVWPRHDKTRADLSNFTFLKKLRISSVCWFLSGVSRRDGIELLIPGSLEDIEIVFGVDSAIHPVAGRNENTYPLSDSSGRMTYNCAWLLELAIAKNNGRLARLEKATLTERTRTGWPGEVSCSSTPWNAPTLVRQAFGDAGILFTASAQRVNVESIPSRHFMAACIPHQ